MSRALQIDALWNGLRDNNGEPLAGGKVYTYEAGTTNDKDTYTDQGATTPAANPIILDGNGRAQIYADGNYKFRIDDSDDNTIQTLDNLIFGASDVEPVWAGTATGSSNAYAGSSSPGESAYFSGMIIQFIANHTNTGAATFNLDSLGAKTIKDAAGNALGAGAIENGGLYVLIYDGTDLILINRTFEKTDIALTDSEYTGSGSMTVASVTTNYAYYTILWPWAFVSLYASAWTIGGTPSNKVFIALPAAITPTQQTALGVRLADGGTAIGATAIGKTTPEIEVRRHDSGNFNAGSGAVEVTGLLYLG
jgi:hypothetical protein